MYDTKKIMTGLVMSAAKISWEKKKRGGSDRDYIGALICEKGEGGCGVVYDRCVKK